MKHVNLTKIAATIGFGLMVIGYAADAAGAAVSCAKEAADSANSGGVRVANAAAAGVCIAVAGIHGLLGLVEAKKAYADVKEAMRMEG